ncbi:hypothetical protein TacPo2_54 [Pantoea bacteriophage TacPo2]
MDSKCYYCDGTGKHRAFVMKVLLCDKCHYKELSKVRTEYMPIRKYRPF